MTDNKDDKPSQKAVATPSEYAALVERLRHQADEEYLAGYDGYADCLKESAAAIERLTRERDGWITLYKATAKIGADDHEKANALITKSQTDHLLLTPLGVEMLDEADATRAERNNLIAANASLQRALDMAMAQLAVGHNEQAEVIDQLRARVAELESEVKALSFECIDDGPNGRRVTNAQYIEVCDRFRADLSRAREALGKCREEFCWHGNTGKSLSSDTYSALVDMIDAALKGEA